MPAILKNRIVSSRRISNLAFAVAASLAGVVWADQAANKIVDSVGLETGLGAALDGSGVKIVVAEAAGISSNPAGGLPQLGNSAPGNPNMPNSGPAAGQDGTITNVTNTFLPPPAAGPPAVFAPSIADHATMVNGVIMGLGTVSAGIAPNSQDFATPIANDPDEIQDVQGLLRSDVGPNASIINFSWTDSGTANNGNELDTSWQDWAALTNTTFLMHNKLFVTAGNETGGNPNRTAPWDNFNGINVGATAGTGTQYLANYNLSDKTADGRFKTDIVAPGGGTANTGGGGTATSTMQSPVVVGGANDNSAAPVGANDGVNSNAQFAGTSFAAPLVTGAAALLTQEATADGYANIDHDALKALILNGASKNVYNGAAKWQAFGANGVKGPGNTPVNIGWDANLGTGLLDVGNSQVNLDAGQFAPGNVPLEGWDYESTATTNMKAATNVANYMFQNTGLDSVTATLAWDRRDQLVKGAGNTNLQLWQPGDTFTTPGLNDLDLKLIDLTSGMMVYQSDSALDSIEHIYYNVPQAMQADQFDLQVYYFAVNDNSFIGSNVTPYGLAWAATVPEPATAGMLLASGMLLLARRRRAARE